MNLTQYLIFEICRECPLGEAHKWCPNTHPERFANSAGQRPMTDEQILAAVHYMICAAGFNGLIGFHYYNEPLAAWPRVKNLIKRIKLDTPLAEFVLWTNGELLPADPSELACFAQVNVTNYANRDLSALKAAVPSLIVRPVRPDQRATISLSSSNEPCRRMFAELIFDYYGNVHPCCYDWRGMVKIGNIHDDPMATIVANWQKVRESITGKAMTADAPDGCKTCGIRHASLPNLYAPVHAVIKEYMELSTTAPEKPTRVTPQPFDEMEKPKEQPFLVVVAHKVRESRVREFFAWNDDVFRKHKIRVILVVAADYTGLPEYVCQFPYLNEMKMFSLAKCKNAGINMALAVNANPIVVADIDLVFHDELMQKMLAVGDREMCVPCYYMCYEEPPNQWTGKCKAAPLATGTLSMRADGWRRIHYDQRVEGYGIEDGIILQDTCHAGYRLTLRNERINHIAHEPGSEQGERDGRTDHHNPEYNAKNYEANKLLLRR